MIDTTGKVGISYHYHDSGACSCQTPKVQIFLVSNDLKCCCSLYRKYFGDFTER